MQLLIVRHAQAEDRVVFARTHQPDALRPILDSAYEPMRQAALGLRRQLDTLDVLATSPYRRAARTAQILADVYGDIAAVEVTELTPDGAPQAQLAWLAGLNMVGNVAMVGHEPGLSRLASQCLCRKHRSLITLKKGGACLIRFKDTPEPSAGKLRWLMTPRQLAQLGA